MADQVSKPDGLDHPMRRELHGELHARPSLYFDGDTDVWHLVVVSKGSVHVPAALAELPSATKTADGKHGIAPLAGGRLKWELHTEFLTLTFLAPCADAPSPPPAFLELRSRIPGETICAVRVVARNENHEAPLDKPARTSWRLTS